MTLTLSAQPRTDKQNDKHRAAGFIPAVVYAPSYPSRSIMVPAGAFEKLYREAGDSTLVDITIEGDTEPVTVLIQDVQMAPVKDQVLHIDFFKVTAGQELSASIALHFIGEAPAVKLGGTLMTQMDAIDVTCLPKDLVNHIEVDLSALAEIGDVIHISDLTLPPGITPEEDGSLVVATVVEQEEEEEETSARSIDDIEVTAKGKKEEADADAK